MPGADSSPLNQKYCLVTSGEAWNNFVDDPWIKENRPLNMNIVTDGFKGDLWGRIRTKLERYSLRFGIDNDFVLALVPGLQQANNPIVLELFANRAGENRAHYWTVRSFRKKGPSYGFVKVTAL